MEYNLDAIGKRIRAERIARGLSQDELISALQTKGVSISRNSVSKLEGGNFSVNLGLNFLAALCKIFDCDMGYLLCEYNERKHIVSDICIETGLSEKAVEYIRSLREKNRIDAVNLLFDVDQKYIDGLFHCLWLCKHPRKTEKSKKYNAAIDAIQGLLEDGIGKFFLRGLANQRTGLAELEDEDDVAGFAFNFGRLAGLAGDDYLCKMAEKTRGLNDQELEDLIRLEIEESNAERDRGLLADAQRLISEIAEEIIKSRKNSNEK